MDDFNSTILNAILGEIEVADGANCAVRIHNLVEHLAKLTRHYWNQGGKGELWESSQPIWRALRELLSRYERLKNPDESSRLWLSSNEQADLDHIALLAGVATSKEHPPVLKHTARKELQWLLSKARTEAGPAQQAIQLIMDLSPASIIIRKESPSPWVISDAPSDHELPTLTSHRRGPVLDNLLNWQIHLADSPRMQEPLLNLIRQGDEDSVFRILDIFDSTDSPRLRNACLEALRLVGGCQVAQQLSARVANIQLYVQCLVLCALEGLACQPYRGPGDDHGESRSQQIETVNTVLRHLLEIPSSADLRDIRDSAVDGVRRHGSQCQSF